MEPSSTLESNYASHENASNPTYRGEAAGHKSFSGCCFHESCINEFIG
jgi:hypothetical protein